MDVVLTNPATGGFQLLFAEPRRLRLDYGRYSLALETGALCQFNDPVTNGRHQHNYQEVCLVLAGQGEFIHGDRRFALSAGDVFLAEPGVDHEIASRQSRDLELVFYSFEITTGRVKAGTRSEETLLGAFLGARRLWAPGGSLLARYAAWLPSTKTEAATGLGAARHHECLLLELLSVLVEPNTTRSARADNPTPDALQRAIDYINGHLQDPLTPEQLAVATGLSSRQLRRLFRTHLGGTIVAEINRRKMNAAAHQLLMRFSVTEVAFRFGMEHPSHFTRTFKQVIGVSPRGFQRRYSPVTQIPRTLRNEN
jgi:AraC-like DNA-binding protein